jgi:adenylosuccinate lyase
MREALALIESDLKEIAEALTALARKHRDTPMIGRSNLQQVVPITFGYKMAALLAAMQQHRQRLSELLPRARDPHVKMFQQKIAARRSRNHKGRVIGVSALDDHTDAQVGE